MRRRRVAVLSEQPAICPACMGGLFQVITLAGGDRQGCPTCEPTLLRINFTHRYAPPTPVYLERKPEPKPGDGPPCPRCERPLSATACAACGYPAAAPPPAKRRRRRSSRP